MRSSLFYFHFVFLLHFFFFSVFRVQAEHAVEHLTKVSLPPESSRDSLLQSFKRSEELSASIGANLKAGAAALSMPVGLLRRSGQLLASLAGGGDQTLVSALGILKDRANAIAMRLKNIVGKESVAKQVVDESEEKALHVDLAQFSSSVKRVFKVNQLFNLRI